MGKTNELIDIIKEKCLLFDINHGDYETLKPKLKEQILKIEETFQHHIKHHQEIREAIKNSKLNVTNIISNSGLQRSSVYNNQEVLKKYIEERIQEIEQTDLLDIYSNEKKKEEYSILKEYLQQTQMNLLENDVLENKIEQLQSELESMYKINESLVEQVNHLNKQLEKEKKAKKKTTTVVNIKND